MKKFLFGSFLATCLLATMVFTTSCEEEIIREIFDTIVIRDTVVIGDPDAPNPEVTVTSNRDNTTASLGDQIGVRSTDGSTSVITLSADTTYILEGRVFVNPGERLVIPAGTVIKGRATVDPTLASVLIVAAGAEIDAQGTASNPIIFTAEADNLNGNIPATTKGLWGGVIVIGNASTNNSSARTIEGIESTSTDPRVFYGDPATATNDADNSGTMRYVSIRFGGAEVADGDEINGLTLYGVGNGTTLEFIEVFGNSDDGFEWFGGTVNSTNIVATFCGDDSFDTDQGYRGVNFFPFVYQDLSLGDHAGENDGAREPFNATPLAQSQFWNATLVGRGDNNMLRLRENTAISFVNGVFFNFNQIRVEFRGEADESSWQRLIDGDALFATNILRSVGTDTLENLFTIDVETGSAPADGNMQLQTLFTNSGNTYASSDIITRANVVPASGTDFGTITAFPAGPIAGLTATPSTPAFKGSFDPSATAWINGWTLTESVIQ